MGKRGRGKAASGGMVAGRRTSIMESILVHIAMVICSIKRRSLGYPGQVFAVTPFQMSWRPTSAAESLRAYELGKGDDIVVILRGTILLERNRGVFSRARQTANLTCFINEFPLPHHVGRHPCP